MGACTSGLTPEEKFIKKRNTDIEKGIRTERRKMREEVKLLLLGAGESGKSTVFKQMKIISSMGGFSNEELLAYRYVVHGNCITQMKVLVNAMQKLQLASESDETIQAAQRLSDLSADPDSWSPEIATDIKTLWRDTAIQNAYSCRDKHFQLNDSAAYFFDNIERFYQKDYLPTFQDVLRARVRSTGIDEADFSFEGLRFRMLDVGGQRSERRKWIHCFEGVTAIIFCVALSEYDQNLREDDITNRMKESLVLFEEICNSQWFVDTAFILFLNKLDLFKEKIKRVDLKATFPQYTGGRQEDPAKAFIKSLFLGVNRTGKTVFSHFTIAIDTKNIEVVFKVVHETLLQQILTDIF